MPKPRLVPAETEVVTPIAEAPRRRRRRRTRRWPLIFMLVFAVSASLLLWAGIVSGVQAAAGLFFN